jgi:two-component system sensor histidine kinase CpxA
MKPRLSLSTKIFFLAFLNLLLLAVVALFFVRAQFRLDLHSFLLGPAQDRILATARLFALELQETPAASRDRLLVRYAQAQRVQCYLMDDDGAQLAGPEMQLPPEVVERVTHRGRRRDATEPSFVRRPPPPPLFLIATANPTRYWVGVRIPVRSPSNDAQGERGTLLFMSHSLLGNPFFFDFKPWLAVVLAVILISVACWLPLIRGLTKSISQMMRATEQIAEGQFDVQAPARRHDEIGQLGAAINRMAARLSGFVKGQKRFLGDIAHELCSPIARIQFALGILDQRATDSQREYVADLREEIQHMSGLVNELLSFSKAGMRGTEVKLAKVNVAETVQRVLDREASAEGQVHTLVDEKLEVLADSDYLFRSLSNLVRNAIRYAGKAGPLTISGRAEDGSVFITVADCGPGLPEEALEEVFTPFYRPEPSRSRETGGSGLGLAIVKTCIESCHGSVSCRNRQPSGLEVEIRLKSAR